MAIFKVDSEYLMFPFKAKVDYFILHSILVYSFVIFLIFFAMNKGRCTLEEEQFFHWIVYMFKRKQKWTTAYQHVISRASHISVSIKGTFWYLSLFFLEWSTINFCYSSRFVSLGFTIRTVTTKKFTVVSLLSFTIQLLQSDLLTKYILDYKSRPPKFRTESKWFNSVLPWCMERMKNHLPQLLSLWRRASLT